MNPKEMQQRMAALIKELEELRKLDTLTDEQDSRVDAIVTEINDLGPKLARAKNVDALLEKNAALVQPRQTVAGIVPKEGAEEEEREDKRSLGRRFVESDEFKALQQRNGAGSAQMEVRTLVGMATLPTNYLEPKRIPGIQRPSDLFGSLRDVLNVGTTDSDSLIYFQESGFTNAAAEVAEATTTSGTDGTKPESAITFTQQTGVVATIAHWIPITRQTIWNASEIQSYIEGRLVDGLKLREDAELLNGNGTAPNLRGLLNTTGVQVLDGAYWTANALASAGTARENFDRVLHAATLVATVGRAQANFVVLNPADYEAYQFKVDANQQYYAAGPFTSGGIPTLWGRRVVLNENIAAKTALVGDGRQATIWDRMQATVEVGQIDKQFIRNMFTLLAEERVGLTVSRPAAFAKVTLV